VDTLQIRFIDCPIILQNKAQEYYAHNPSNTNLGVLLLVICNSVKMGIRLCYKWEEPEEMVKVEKYSIVFTLKSTNQLLNQII
jgi:hypothetical protein